MLPEPADPEGMTDDAPILNKFQPAFPNLDAAPGPDAKPVPEPPEPPQLLEAPLPQPPEPEQQPFPEVQPWTQEQPHSEMTSPQEVSNVGNSLPHFGGDSPVEPSPLVEQPLPNFGSVPREAPANAEEPTAEHVPSLP